MRTRTISEDYPHLIKSLTQIKGTCTLTLIDGREYQMTSEETLIELLDAEDKKLRRPKTSTEKSRDRRSRLRAAGYKELRNLWASPEDEAAIRAFATDLEKRRQLQTKVGAQFRTLNKA